MKSTDNGRSMRSRLLALSVLALVAAAPSLAEPVSQSEQVDALFAEWNRADSAGCAVGVVKSGQLVHRGGYGQANLDHGVPITTTTVFDIGSTSKQFTAVAILLLAADGKLSLDDPVRKHVPELPDYGSPITVRHLLHHTSGIRDYLTVGRLAGAEPHDVYRLDDVVGIIARQQGLNFEPGAEHLYSNSGYILLAAIVERVAEQPLGDFLRERVFAPLAMDRTQVYDDATRIIKGRATGYSEGEDGPVIDHFYNFAVPGDGQIYTTVEDLSRWDQVFYSYEVLGEKLVRALHTQGVLNDGETIDYARGLVVGEYKGLKTVRHGGGWGGFRSELLRFPEERLSVICLCNFGSIAPGRMAEKVAEIYLADRLVEEPAGEQQAPGEEPAVALDAEALGAFAGAFRNPRSGNVWRFAVDDGVLSFESFLSGRTYRLAPRAARSFQVVEPRLEMEIGFEETGDGGLKVTTTGRAGEGEMNAVELVHPDPEALASYAGDYVSEDLGTTYGILLDGDHLVVRIGRSDDRHELRPGVRDVFFVAGFAMFEFRRNQEGEIVGFDLSAGRVKNLRFRRLESGTPE